MIPDDLIEDFLAFLYTTGDRKSTSTGTDDTICCQFCGAELEENEETGELRCPECG